MVGDAIPFLGWLDLGGEVKEMKKTAIEMDNIVSEWLEEHKQQITDSGDTKTEQDFIDVLLFVLKGVDLAGYDFDTVIKATCTVRSTIYLTLISILLFSFIIYFQYKLRHLNIVKIENTVLNRNVYY